MTEQQQRPAMININGQEYKVENLSDDAKAQLKGLQVAEIEIKRLNTQLALVQTARNAYMHALQDVLPKDK